jgi:predicted ATPase/DNA-binding SARP family transcriptional activator
MGAQAWGFAVLGPLRVEHTGHEVSLRGALPRTLLALLLERADRPQSTATLIDGIWGERQPAQAQAAFHVHLSKVRKELGPLLIKSAAGYQLAPGEFALDADAFAAAVSAASTQRPAAARATLGVALELWRGEPLADLPSNERLDPWRAELEESQLRARILRVDADLELGLDRGLVPEITRLVAASPYEEKLTAQLMVALYRAGRQVDALDAFDRTRRRLLEDLGLEPGEGLRRLQDAVLAQDPGLRIPAAAAASAVSNSPAPTRGEAARPLPTTAAPAVGGSRLPQPATRLVGRETDLAELAALTDAGACRLLTLTGLGGVGKTRLALEHGGRWSRTLRDGGTFVSLSQLDDTKQIRAEIASSIARDFGVSEPTEVDLARHLAERELLLVIDNWEHLLDGAAMLSELLGAVPGLRILATSRAPLRLRGEHVFEVRPLEVSSAGEPALGTAVELFLDGARAASRDFAVDPLGRELVAAICRGLDGLPLAIELASARAGQLSLIDIHAALQQPLQIGGEGLRDLPGRQRSLSAVFDWSFELLSPATRTTLMNASVFQGSFTAEMLAAVCGHPVTEPLRELQHARLVEVLRESNRYALLQLVRAYGSERLAADLAGRTAARDRHQHYFTDRFRPLLADRKPADIGDVARKRAGEHADLRAAVNHAIDAGDGDGALPILIALHPIWMAGHLAESGEIMERALANCSFSPPDELELLGVTAYANAYRPEGELWTQRRAERATALGNVGTIVSTTVNLISGALDRRDWQQALRHRDELAAITDLDQLSPGHLVARSAALAGCAYLEGDLAASVTFAEEATAQAVDAHPHTAAGARLIHMQVESAASARITRTGLLELLEVASSLGVPDLAVAALWLCARYAVNFDTAFAAELLGLTEQHAAAADIYAWPDIELRDEALSAIGQVDAGALISAAAQPLSDVLELATGWLSNRPVGETGARMAAGSAGKA